MQSSVTISYRTKALTPTPYYPPTPRQPPPTTVYSQSGKSWWQRHPKKSSTWDQSYHSDENWGHWRPSDAPSQPSHASGPTSAHDDDDDPEELPLSDLKTSKADEWAQRVKWALNHPERVKAGNELRDDEKPILRSRYDGRKARAFRQRCRQLAPEIPDSNLQHMIKVLAASDAFDHLVLDDLKVP